MAGRLGRQLVDHFSEPTLRRIQRVRHGESPSLRDPVGRAGIRGVTPQTVTRFDAHAVRAEVSEALAAALDKAGVGYVLVPGPRGTVCQIAVDDDDRAEVLAAVRATATGPGWSIQPPGGKALGRAARIRVHRVLATPKGHLLCGPDTATEIAFWTRVAGDGVPRADGDPHTPGTRVAPKNNPVVAYLTAEAWARATTSLNHWPVERPRPYTFDVREPVDIVYTWVDGDDPQWQGRKAGHEPTGGASHNVSATHPARFTNRDELRFSMRSVAMFAGWVRHVYVVTDQQTPAWLDTDHPQVRLIDHRDIFTDPSVLPVFNSHAIESQLHHIPDLAERYLYFNDDMFFGRPVEPELFFHGNGIARFFLSRKTLDLDPPSARDLPATSGAKRNRELIEQDFGVTIRNKMLHGVYPQLRSVLTELEERHPDMFARVSASRFRHPDDNSIVSSLQQYYAYAQGRAVPGDVQYRYQDISLPDTARRLDEFLRQRPQVFCLNDMGTPEDGLDLQHLALRQFFDEYFPLPSPFERPAQR
jgi:hypothetical protein